MGNPILEHIEKIGKDVSFSELEHVCAQAGYKKIDNYVRLGFNSEKNVFVWETQYQELADVYSDLIKNYQVSISDPMIYLLDGGAIPMLPTAKEDKIYKTLHWLPVVFSKKTP